MIQVAPNRSQKGLVALAVLASVAIFFVATYRPFPGEPIATSDASEGAVAASPTPGSSPSSRPTARPTPRPTQGPCSLPASLPTEVDSAAVPKVDSSAGSILFASPTYLAFPEPVAADNPSLVWEMGLWFVPAPGADPRLITAAGDGMVIPLALAPAGDLAAVWWWPDRRAESEAHCEQGIYLLNLTTPTSSQLIDLGDWSIPAEIEAATWEDPTQGPGLGLRFRLPNVSFSSDGALIAIVDGDAITVLRPGDASVAARHVGSCPVWGWDPFGSTFAAGCEDMTSVWLVDASCCDEGLGSRSLAIPKPTIDQFPADWENSTDRAIGITADRDVRIVRTYGFATGCEGPGECEIPPPAWAVTTLDWETGKAVHGGSTVDFLFEAEARLSADASWFYSTEADTAKAVTIDLASGVIRRVGLAGTPAGAAADGSALYGWATDGTAVVTHSTTRGTTADVATIAWPDRVVARTPGIPITGLWVAAAP